MMTDRFLNYISQFSQYQQRSMFGGIGLFFDDAMFALISQEHFYLRGGPALDALFIQLDCEKYKHVKKQTTATVNYYDVTKLFIRQAPQLDELILSSIQCATKERSEQKQLLNQRLRDLPNMQLTLERMVKKAGIDDVDTFLSLGAVKVFKQVQHTYGNDVDTKLLWKFAGAESGAHWKLIQESQKEQLMTELLNVEAELLAVD